MAANGSEFQEFYSPNLTRSAAIGFSVVAVVLNPIALLIVVWYERYRAGHVRTLINQVSPILIKSNTSKPNVVFG